MREFNRKGCVKASNSAPDQRARASAGIAANASISVRESMRLSSDSGAELASLFPPRHYRGKLMEKLHPGESIATPYEAAGEARSKFVEGQVEFRRRDRSIFKKYAGAKN
jgi:hypothetical protein